MLKKESELPLEDLIKSLPPEAFQDDKHSESSNSEDETDNVMITLLYSIK